MQTIKLMAVGDISLFARDNQPPFMYINEPLKEADVLFGNLETALCNRGTLIEKAVTLSTSPDRVRYVKDARLDLLNIANNHIMDRGLLGAQYTLNALRENSLLLIGIHDPSFSEAGIVIERRGLKLGSLGYRERGNSSGGIHINKLSEPEIIRDIRSFKGICDHVIVSPHWGLEKIFLSLARPNGLGAQAHGKRRLRYPGPPSACGAGNREM